MAPDAIHLPPADQAVYSVGAVLLSANGRRLLLNASSLQVEQQKVEVVGGKEVSQTLPGGTMQCEECSRTNIPSVMEGVQKFLFTTMLPFDVASGALMVASFKV